MQHCWLQLSQGEACLWLAIILFSQVLGDGLWLWSLCGSHEALPIGHTGIPAAEARVPEGIPQFLLKNIFHFAPKPVPLVTCIPTCTLRFCIPS